jgi:hypothetical protein
MSELIPVDGSIFENNLLKAIQGTSNDTSFLEEFLSDDFGVFSPNISMQNLTQAMTLLSTCIVEGYSDKDTQAFIAERDRRFQLYLSPPNRT